MKNMQKYIYGIDFGTSNSTLAILDLTSEEIVQVFTIPSLLFFPDSQISKESLNYSVGERATQHYLDSAMEGRFMKSIKKVLPSKLFTHTQISNTYLAAEDLVALILAQLKNAADDFLGENIHTAVIGRPVLFSTDPEKDALAQERLAMAAEMVGFDTYYFQLEPIGAALTYERQLMKDELVLVADFGGGTSDFSLMHLSPNSVYKRDRKADMIAKGGIYIGGDNFDSDIMWHKGTPHFGRGVQENIGGKWLDLPLSYFFNICSWEKMNFFDSIRMTESIRRSYLFSGKNAKVQNLLTLVGKNLGYSIFQEIEATKIKLTEQDSVDFAFDNSGIDFSENISIEDFGQVIIEKNVEKIATYMDSFLAENNVKHDEVQTVFLTGGSSLVRPLRAAFAQRFDAERLKSGENFISVAMGLAYSFPVLATAQANRITQ